MTYTGVSSDMKSRDRYSCGPSRLRHQISPRIVVTGRVAVGLQRLAAGIVEVRWHGDPNRYQQVTLGAVTPGCAPTADGRSAVGCTRWHIQRDGAAAEDGYLHMRAERSLVEGDREHQFEVVALAGEDRVLVDVHHDVQIAVRAAALTRAAMPFSRMRCSPLHAGGYPALTVFVLWARPLP